MEWVAEGLTLVFIGALTALAAVVGGVRAPVPVLVCRSCAVMLLVMAAWSLLTGARTSVLPMKLCPAVKTAVAALYIIATLP